MSGFDLYERFYARPPHRVVAWRDDQTDAVGWLALDTLRGGAAGGGTRMRAGGTQEEAVLLAKTMSIKFTVAGPDGGIGGAKSVIRFDPARPEREGVLRRWFRHIADHLRTHYGTGSDANTTEAEVTALLAEEGIVRHPQEGIVRGHFGSRYSEAAIEQAIHQLEDGVALEVDVPGFGRVEAGDLVTGYGTVRGLAHYYAARGETLEGKRVLLQGFGNVGAAAAHYLAAEGARVVGVTAARLTADGAAFQLAADPAGLDVAAELTAPGRPRGALHPARCAEGAEAADAFWDLAADAFIPAATSDLITPAHLDRLQRAGVRAFSCGANGPFEGSSAGRTAVMRDADQRFAVVPDFIANCGAARFFAYLMQTTPEVAAAVETGDVAAFLADVDRAVGAALGEVLNGAAPETGLLERAYTVFVPRATAA